MQESKFEHDVQWNSERDYLV